MPSQLEFGEKLFKLSDEQFVVIVTGTYNMQHGHSDDEQVCRKCSHLAAGWQAVQLKSSTTGALVLALSKRTSESAANESAAQLE